MVHDCMKQKLNIIKEEIKNVREVIGIESPFLNKKQTCRITSDALAMQQVRIARYIKPALFAL